MRIPQKALRVRDRYAAGVVSDHGVDIAGGHAFNQALDALEHVDPQLQRHR